MKICWDNLEVLYLTKKGNLKNKNGGGIYIERSACKRCGDTYLTYKIKQSEYCSRKCAMFGKKHSDETKRRISEAKKGRLEGRFSGKNNSFYGRKHTEETKRKTTKAHYGKSLSEEHKKKIGFASRAFMDSKEQRIKMSKVMSDKNNSFYGKRHTEETKRKISANHADMSGSNSPSWKGGISCEPYCDVWLDKDFKESIKERDNRVCQNPDCKQNSIRLCIHHIDYNKKNCHPSNLITVCNSCNARANFDRDWHTAYYNEVMKRRNFNEFFNA